MTKKEMVEVIANDTGLTKRAVTAVFDEAFELVAKDIAKTKSARVYGFGTFKVVNRAARVIKNPKTGKEVKVPAKKTVTFKPADVLKNLVK